MSRHVQNRPRNSATTKWLSLATLAFLQGTCPISSAQIAVNPVTNKVYAGNETLPYVNVIDGMTHKRSLSVFRRNSSLCTLCS